MGTIEGGEDNMLRLKLEDRLMVARVGTEQIAEHQDEINRLSALRRERIYKAYIAGVSQKDIAEHLGLHFNTVWKEIDKYRKELQA